MKTTHSRTDVRYWLSKIKKPSAGDGHRCKDYSVQIAHQGRRVRFPLKSPNKEAAAKKAQQIYLEIITNGWDEALEKFKPTPNPQKAVTIAEYISVIQETSKVGPRTFQDYLRAFRRIVSDLEKIERKNSRFDYRSKKKGSQNWRERVDQTPLSKLTPEKITKWMLAQIKTYQGDPLKLKSRKNSVNSYVRQAKALFSRKHVEIASKRLALPDLLPFEGVDFFPRSSTRYVSRINPHELLRAAAEELGQDQADDEPYDEWHERTQIFKAFLLGICVGLRRREIDTLLWDQFDGEKGIIRIEETRFFKPKSEDSVGEVALDPELTQLFRKFQKDSSGQFVIESPNAPRPNATYSFARAEHLFKLLYQWLRDHGVENSKPLHTLRKEFGSLINEQFGIYAASLALRHADTSVTAAYYLDQKQRVSVGLGAMLSTQEK